MTARATSRAASQLVQHGALAFLSVGVLNGAAFVFYAYAGHVLDVRRYGELYALLALFAVSSVPSIVMALVIAKETAELRSAGRSSALHYFIKITSAVLVCVAMAVGILGVVLRQELAEFLKVPPGTIVATSLLAAFAVMLTPLRAVLQGVDDFASFAFSGILEGLGKTFLGCLFLAMGFGVTGAIGGYAIGSGIALAYTAFVSVRPSWAVPSVPVTFDFRRLSATLAGAAALTVAVNALNSADVLLVKHYMGPAQAGVYSAVSLGGKIVFLAAGFIPMVLLPKAAHASFSGTPALRVLRVSLVAWAVLCTVLLAAFYFCPQGILHVLVGKQLAPATPLLFYCGLAMAFLAGMNVAASYKIAVHRFDFIYPFAIVTLGEIAGVVAYHPSLGAVIATLAIGNAMGFVAALYRI